jgi:uncharacterized protein YdeI (YjbR/CyaY-like superfamily)
METLEARDRAEWRRWLARNHAKASEVWLVFHKVRVGGPALSYDESVEEALCFGWIDSLIRRIDESRYARKFTPRKPGSRWSPSNRARAEKMIEAGLMTPRGLALVEEARAGGEWAKAGAPRPVQGMPAELAEALHANREAKAGFEALPPALKRQYAAWVGSAKRAATRERRATELTAVLARGERLGLK